MVQITLGKIVHPVRMLFLALIFLGFSLEKTQAQSEVWAGGEIVFDYHSGACGDVNDPPSYKVKLRFFRDEISNFDPLPATKQVLVYRQGDNLTNAFAHTLVLDSTLDVRQYCLNGNPVATEGGFYVSPDSLPLYPEGAWRVAYIGPLGPTAGQYRSPEDRNISLGQRFYLESIINNTCGVVTGNQFVNGQLVPVTRINPLPEITATEFVFPELVSSFCVGKSYEHNFKAIPGAGIKRVEFDWGAVLKFINGPTPGRTNVNFLPGYSNSAPFPSSAPIRLDKVNGILEFTPSQPFAGPVNFQVVSYIPAWAVDPADPNQIVRQVDREAVRSFREYRYIFDTNCNSRLPDFEGGNWVRPDPNLNVYEFRDNYNATEDAYEYDCASTVFEFRLSEPVLAASLGIEGIPYDQQDQGFRFASVGGAGGDLQFTDDIPVEKVEPIRIININETDLLRVTLSKPAGPGKYILYMKKGDDLNTLVNRCESTLPENDTLATILVNGKFKYVHPKDEYKYCYPSGLPPTANIKNDYGNAIYYSGWKYYGGDNRFQFPGDFNTADDTTFLDTAYLGPQSFVLDKPEDEDWVNSKINIAAGWWEVGFGLDFSTRDPLTGQITEERICYDTDTFYVDTVTVEEFEIPDYDLCPKEDLPVIDLSSYSNDIIAQSFQWGKWDQNAGPDNDGFALLESQSGLKDSLGKVYDNVSTKSYIFDTEGAYTGVGDTNFFRAYFNMKGKYQPQKYCRLNVEFKVIKTLIDVELNTEEYYYKICEGEEFELSNTTEETFFIPEQYSYQWFLDDTPIPGETTKDFTFSQSGKHKLVVTKTTDESVCTKADSMLVDIVPQMDSMTTPGCIEITFNNGQVEQVFAWGTIATASKYQARVVDQFNSAGQFEDANGLYGIQHRSFGAQVGLEVRGVNDNADEGMECRYSDTTYAQPCEAIVKPTNVFTPNGDGINDFLKFDLIELYPGSALQIFNRWGELIYEDSDYFNDWDGENYKAGTYFYVININDPLENNDQFKGTFTIIRD